jgi:hypothetical protein
MPYGIYISAAGADVQSKRLQVLSHNLANVDTPGFKREFSILQAQAAEAIEQGLEQEGSGSINDIGGGVSLVETVMDHSMGGLRQTGIETDMAIDLVASLDAIDGLAAELTPSFEVKIAAESADIEFNFANDTSGVLAALGLNVFFRGLTPQTLEISSIVKTDPENLRRVRAESATTRKTRQRSLDSPTCL